jgi:hypothetical protein
VRISRSDSKANDDNSSISSDSEIHKHVSELLMI